MSKYLTTGRSTRYNRSDQLNDSAYARATRLFRDKNDSSGATDLTGEVQQSVQLIGADDYAEHDLQQFSAMTDFPVNTNTRKITDHRIWESCHFTDQDDAGFKQLQHELNAVANSKQ